MIHCRPVASASDSVWMLNMPTGVSGMGGGFIHGSQVIYDVQQERNNSISLYLHIVS